MAVPAVEGRKRRHGGGLRGTERNNAGRRDRCTSGSPTFTLNLPTFVTVAVPAGEGREDEHGGCLWGSE